MVQVYRLTVQISVQIRSNRFGLSNFGDHEQRNRLARLCGLSCTCTCLVLFATVAFHDE